MPAQTPVSRSKKVKQAFILGAVAGLVMAASPASESTAPDAAARASAYSTKKICREEVDLGTRLGGKRICRTRAEWDQIRSDSRKTTEKIQSSTSACLRGGACGG
jgi:hypothetical protein